MLRSIGMALGTSDILHGEGRSGTQSCLGFPITVDSDVVAVDKVCSFKHNHHLHRKPSADYGVETQPVPLELYCNTHLNLFALKLHATKLQFP